MPRGERRQKILSAIANFFRRSQLRPEQPMAKDRDVKRAAKQVIRKYKKDLEELGKY